MTVAPAPDFWSRRKAAVRAEAEALAAAKSAECAPAIETGEARTDEQVLADLGLKDPDLLEPGDDFAAFLRHDLPVHLRQRALRRLWRSNPVLANLDGLVDHGEDYTDKAVVPPVLATAYQVGRGMLAHLQAVVAEPSEDGSDTPEILESEPAETVFAEDDAVDGAPAEAVTDAPPTRRHMRFVFNDREHGETTA